MHIKHLFDVTGPLKGISAQNTFFGMMKKNSNCKQPFNIHQLFLKLQAGYLSQAPLNQVPRLLRNGGGFKQKGSNLRGK